MNVIKCSNCSIYIEKTGESYYVIYEQIKNTRDKQCVLKLCSKCYHKKYWELIKNVKPIYR